MQQNDEKSIQFSKTVGELVKELRLTSTDKPINKLADEYDIGRATLSKLENGIHHRKFITIWKLSEALGIKCSELVRMLEEKLGDDFSLIDE